MSEGFIVWFTGLSGAGKSTLSAMLAAELRNRRVHVEVLDGDEVRTHLSKGLSFSKEDRDINIRRIGFVAKLLARAGACVMTAAISPYKSIRDEQRLHTPRFVEVYCACDIGVLAERDIKGLYKKAMAGEIKHFTGIDDPYEPPDNPEVTVYTDKESREESVSKIVARLEELGYIPLHGTSYEIGREIKGYKKALVSPHGGELCRRWLRGDAKAALLEKARSMPVIDIGVRSAVDVDKICSGAFSPLKGFMGSKDYLRVLKDMRLENGLPWPMVVALPISTELAASLSVGAQAALRDHHGRVVAVLDIHDLFKPDPALEASALSKSAESFSHSIVYAGGELHGLDRPNIPWYSPHHLDPAETRAVFAERGFGAVAGFYAAEPPSREHEHWMKTALEICDGVLINSMVDDAGPNEFSSGARFRAWEALLEGYFPAGRALLSAYADKDRPRGLRASLMNALVHKNYGCSHFIAAGGGRLEHRAQELFASPELGIEILSFERAFYSQALGAMGTEKTAPGDESTRIYAEGALLYKSLKQGKSVAPERYRPCVVNALADSISSD